MEIGNRIFDVRKKTGLNQADFGKRIGVTRSAICNYENGSRSVGEQVILSICREFNVSEEWLRTGSGEMFINRSRDDELSAFVDELLSEKSVDFRRRLVTALSRMSPEQWDALEALALGLMKDPVPPGFTPAPVPNYEAEARAEAEAYYRKILAEKEAAAKASALASDTTSELADIKRRIEALEQEDMAEEIALALEAGSSASTDTEKLA